MKNNHNSYLKSFYAILPEYSISDYRPFFNSVKQTFINKHIFQVFYDVAYNGILCGEETEVPLH